MQVGNCSVGAQDKTAKLGTGNEENVAIPTYVAALEGTHIVHISAGCEHSAAIARDGSLFTWGHGDGGRLGHGDNSQSMLPARVLPLQMNGVTPFSVHCGDKFTVVLAHDNNNQWEGFVEEKLLKSRNALLKVSVTGYQK